MGGSERRRRVGGREGRRAVKGVKDMESCQFHYIFL